MEKCRITTSKNCEPCYQGKFWEHTTNKFVRWHELTRENTHNEEEDINTTGC